MNGRRLRIVSLVPSWTETLIEAGAHVVGRTRFCIHPKSIIDTIPAVGGTKQFDFELIKSLKPDLILFDREENTKEMAELTQATALLHVSHVQAVGDLPGELLKLSEIFAKNESERNVAESLRAFQKRYEAVVHEPTVALRTDSLPGLIKWIQKPTSETTHLVYIIWRNPWMAVAGQTFIASMLREVGFGADSLWPPALTKYPEFSVDDVPENALILFSSEPYPFEKRPATEFGSRAQALVDGESFSWFGIRSLKFLESVKFDSAR